MTHFTIFGGAELEMQPDTQTVFTLFGGTDLACPTVAQTLLRMTGDSPRTSPWSRQEEAARRPSIYITIFGGTSLNRPLLAREYMDVKGLFAAGSIDPGDFQVLWLQHTSRPFREFFRTVTLFGACEIAVPGKKAEQKALAGLRERGLISQHELAELSGLIEEDRLTALAHLPRIAGDAVRG